MRRLTLVMTAMACTAGWLGATPRIGVQGHTFVYHPDNHARSVEMMAEAGIEIVRDECLWNMVEREPGVYTLPEGWDERVDQTVEAGLDVLLILDYFNDHYDDNLAPHTDEGREAYARYCEFMVESSRGRIGHFEIWNEPNSDGFWPPRRNPADYAALVAVAAPAIRAADPDAYVIGGVTSTIDFPFLEAMIEAGVCEHLDAISVHPYITPDAPEPRGIWNDMARLRDLTAEHTPDGEPLEIWITEFGYPTGGMNSVDENRQADLIARMYLGALARPWITSTFMYWFGPDGPEADYHEDNFGLVRNDWTTKPSFTAVQTLSRLFASAEYAESLAVSQEIEAHIFTLPEGGDHSHLTALWTWDGVRHLEIGVSDPLTLVTRDGDAMTLTPVGGKVSVDVSGEPLSLLTTGAPQITEPAAPLAAFSQSRWTIPRGRSRPVALSVRGEADLVARLRLRTEATDAIAPLGMPSASRGPFSILAALLRPRADARPAVYPFPAILETEDMDTGERTPVARLLAEIEVVRGASVTLTPLMPEPGETNRFLVTVANAAPGVVSAEVRLVAPPEFTLEPAVLRLDEIPGQGETEAIVTVMTDEPPDRVLAVEAEVTLNSGEVIAHRDHMAFVTSPRTAPLTVDGDLSDWPEGDSIHLDRREQLSGELRPWDGPNDCSALVFTAWDEDWFYVAAEVQDQAIADAIEGSSIYKSDGLEVYFDTDHEGDRAHERYSDDDNQMGLIMQHGDAVVYHWSHVDDYSQEAQITINRAPSPEQTITGEPCGYIVEAAIPLDEINLRDPHHGMHIGFNAAVNDDDDPTREHPFGQDVQLMWTGMRNVWLMPQTFGDLFLIDPGKGG